MADLYRQQLLLSNEIEARRKASHYAFCADQIQWGLYDQVLSAGAYILLNKKDSAEIILKSALEQYRKHGYTQHALRFSRTLMHLYTDSFQRLEEAKALMDQFESESELFDENHELPPSQHQYYDYKGKYYEGINRLDSAEYYYRKIYRPGLTPVEQDPMYKGLLSVFTKQHKTDSMAKYALLYGIANDSSIALKDQELVSKMVATYNYSRQQKEAYKNEVKAYKTLLGLIISAAVAVLALVAAFLVWKRFRRKYQQEIMQLKTEYANASYEYEENLRELQLLESAHQENESERKRLLDENVELQSRIRELQKEKAISRNLSVSALFAEEPIVKRFHEIGVQPLENVKEEEWAELTDTFANSYPDLFLDLCQYCNTPQSIRVCMLTVMGLGNNEQANLLETTSSRISNVKLALNKALFNESSSRTLNKNLLMQYSVY
jgi:hypothetical protein